MNIYVDFSLRLFVAGLMGVLIGLEREYRAKEAGYRTHFLVALGSALLMIVSQYGFMDVLEKDLVRLDPSRLAAQVVSGIGFIGAGTILIQKQFVRGLTTAAGLWATSGSRCVDYGRNRTRGRVGHVYDRYSGYFPGISRIGGSQLLF